MHQPVIDFGCHRLDMYSNVIDVIQHFPMFLWVVERRVGGDGGWRTWKQFFNQFQSLEQNRVFHRLGKETKVDLAGESARRQLPDDLLEQRRVHAPVRHGKALLVGRAMDAGGVADPGRSEADLLDVADRGLRRRREIEVARNDGAGRIVQNGEQAQEGRLAVRANPAIEFNVFTLVECEGEIDLVGDRAILQVGLQFDLVENATARETLDINDEGFSLGEFGEHDLHAGAVTAGREERHVRQESSARSFGDRARNVRERLLRAAAADLKTDSMWLFAGATGFAFASISWRRRGSRRVDSGRSGQFLRVP